MTTKQEIAALKREMRQAGIRITSCLNGGLSPEERAYNVRLFILKSRLIKETTSVILST